MRTSVKPLLTDNSRYFSLARIETMFIHLKSVDDQDLCTAEQSSPTNGANPYI